MNKIITGEKIQQLCDVYFGFQSDFDFNPNIKDQKNKQFELKNLYEDFYNPRYIYIVIQIESMNFPIKFIY
jgi:hypothetical protein